MNIGHDWPSVWHLISIQRYHMPLKEYCSFCGDLIIIFLTNLVSQIAVQPKFVFRFQCHFWATWEKAARINQVQRRPKCQTSSAGTTGVHWPFWMIWPSNLSDGTCTVLNSLVVSVVVHSQAFSHHSTGYCLQTPVSWYTSFGSLLEVVLDKVWVKHWEYNSWITFKSLSFKMWKSDR
jgi:hypothetical protein